MGERKRQEDMGCVCVCACVCGVCTQTGDGSVWWRGGGGPIVGMRSLLHLTAVFSRFYSLLHLLFCPRSPPLPPLLYILHPRCMCF